MAVQLSPVFGVAGQVFNDNGDPLAGGKIFTYAAGTTTPAATYTSASGGIAHANPIVLDGAGRVPTGEIWLTDGISYKFVVQDAANNLIGTYDNLTGINSNFVAFINQQEIQTATAGQTVFTLTTTQYQPGTNSLSVFVDGVNQYGPGAQYAYVETDSTTVTFTNGLHVGAEVKFTTSQLNSSGATDASLVSYDPPFVGSVPTNVEIKLSQFVSVQDFGAVGDGITDDTAAIRAAFDASNQVYFPYGTYMVDPDVGTGEIFLIENKDQFYISGYGATIKLVDGAGLYGANTFEFRNSKNVNVEGLTIDGNKQNQSGGYIGIAIFGGENLVFRDLVIKNSKLDGIYIRASNVNVEATYPKNILIENVYIDNANRNGISVIGCKQLTIKNSALVNTDGEAPGAGIDFEPNVSDIFGIEDVIVDGLFVEGNAGRGIVVTGNNPASPGQTPYSRNVAFSNIIARNNGVQNDIVFRGCDFSVFLGENITLNGFLHDGQNYDPYDPALIYIFNTATNVTLSNLYFSNFQPTDNTKSCVYFDSSSEPYRFINNVYAYNCNARALRLDGFNQVNNVQIQDCTGAESLQISGASTIRNVLINNSPVMVVNNNGGSVEGINIINPTGRGIRIRTSNTTLFDINIRSTGTPATEAIWLDIFSNCVLESVRISDAGGYWATPANAYVFSSGLASLAGNFIANCNPSPLSGSTTWDPASIAPGGAASTTVALLRGNIGDACVATHSVSLQGLISFASVTAANTATVTLFNPTGGAIDLASHTVTATATK